MLNAQDLARYDYFSSLSEGALNELAGRLEPVDMKSGEMVIRQGTPAEHYFFVLDGELEVTKRNRFGQEAIISVVGKGQGFGETALLTCSHRTCSVSAKSDIRLLRLGKKDFEDIVMLDSSFKCLLSNQSSDHENYNKMKSLRPFALLTPEKMMKVTEKLVEEKYKEGEDIIKQGDPPGPYYVIRSGSVEVLKEKDGKTTQLAVLGEGEGFGEEAIIRDQGRGATVRAKEYTTVLSLSKRDFDMLLARTYIENEFPEEIPDEDRTKYVYIDARVPPEYEEEHIEGAVNIPIEVLRARFPELDKDQEYITYCTNDSRGMAAAFLLSSNGFKAKCLRGGLSGWAGPTSECLGGVHMPKR